LASNKLLLPLSQPDLLLLLLLLLPPPTSVTQRKLRHLLSQVPSPVSICKCISGSLPVV
jgi:hypothetical protein